MTSPTEFDACAAARERIADGLALANAGGVVAWYFEWAQDRQGSLWEEELVSARLHATTTKAFEATLHRSESVGVSLRRAAVALGLGRVAEATRLRGLFQ